MADLATLPLLQADCARCAGLCCVGTTLTRSADFAIDKPAGVPCPHLAGDDRCGIHAQLRPRGFPGCTTYDCFGAGQRVVQQTYGGRGWRDEPERAAQLFRVFGTVRALHELLWLLVEAVGLPGAAPLRGELTEAARRTHRLAGSPATTLETLDVEAHRAGVVPLLRRSSELARAGARGSGEPGTDLSGRDLVGRDLRGADLRGAALRGALLVGADLRGSRLHLVDLTGADLRGADLRGTDLSTALFLTQAQVDSAHGDTATRLPIGRHHPQHWTPSPQEPR